MKFFSHTLPFAGALLFGATPSALAQFQYQPYQAFFTGPYPQDVSAADLDNDGDIDLVASLRTPPRIAVLRKSVGQKLETPEYTPVVGARWLAGICAADLDNDGKSDIAVLGRDTSDLWILHNLGDANFVEIAHIPVGAGPTELECNDLDGDCDLDFVISNELGNSVSVVMNEGNGVFSAQTEISIGAAPKGLAVGYFGFQRGSLRLADIAVADHDSHAITVLANQGDGTFALAATLTIPQNSHPEGLVVRDFNRDDLDDIAACYSGATTNKVAVFYRTSGGFSAPVLYNVGSEHPTHMVSEDLDRDGRLDLAFVSPISLHVTALRQREDNTFGFQGMWDVEGLGSNHLIAVDLDGSGFAELVATNDDNSSLSVLYNEFESPLAYCYGAPNSVGDGATLSWSGAPSISGCFVLTVSGAPGEKLGTFLYSDVSALRPFHSGYLCVAPPIVRMGPPITTYDDGSAKLMLDFSVPPVGSGPAAITAGSAWNFQFWYRDTLPTGGFTSNTTNGVRAIFLP